MAAPIPHKLKSVSPCCLSVLVANPDVTNPPSDTKTCLQCGKNYTLTPFGLEPLNEPQPEHSVDSVKKEYLIKEYIDDGNRRFKLVENGIIIAQCYSIHHAERIKDALELAVLPEEEDI